MSVGGRPSIAGVQVALGIAAHVTTAGCSPSLPALAVTTPALGVALVVMSSRLGAFPRWMSLVIGQTVVHAALSVAAGCTGHAAAGGHVGVLDVTSLLALVMVPAHAGALLLSVLAVSHVERAVDAGAQLVRQLVCALPRAVALLLRPALACRVELRVWAFARSSDLRHGTVLAAAGPRAPPARLAMSSCSG